MEKDIGYKLLKSINLCFIYIQYFFQIQIFGFERTNQERSGFAASDTERGRRQERGIRHRFFISACKVRPVPGRLSKAEPFGFPQKSSSLRLRYFYGKPCTIRHGTAGQARNKISAHEPAGV